MAMQVREVMVHVMRMEHPPFRYAVSSVPHVILSRILEVEQAGVYAHASPHSCNDCAHGCEQRYVREGSVMTMRENMRMQMRMVFYECVKNNQHRPCGHYGKSCKKHP